MHRVNAELGVSQTSGIGNVSYGLPERDTLNKTFASAAIMAGVTCATVDAAKGRQSVLASDLILWGTTILCDTSRLLPGAETKVRRLLV